MPNALLSIAGWEAPITERSSPDAAPKAGVVPPLARDRAAAADAALLGWAAAGDRLAFDQLATRHLPALYRIGLRITGSAAEAEEVAQEALLRAWRNAARFDPARGQVGTWLYSIASHAAIDRARRATPLPLDAAPETADPAPDPEAALAARERQALLGAALRELPPRQRAALALSHDQGLSGAEAAAALSISTRALEGLLRRARFLLASRLRGILE
ncbi:sigma-70 family RNA polymerase sigma factor [Teichococcus aestuarii]|uniref:sigma-70 family RNA polymerase sigma factor n=1 Tax=Teichococcus aestuarii TaxID=568898 RepID=UPI003622E25E